MANELTTPITLTDELFEELQQRWLESPDQYSLLYRACQILGLPYERAATNTTHKILYGRPNPQVDDERCSGWVHGLLPGLVLYTAPQGSDLTGFLQRDEEDWWFRVQPFDPYAKVVIHDPKSYPPFAQYGAVITADHGRDQALPIIGVEQHRWKEIERWLSHWLPKAP